ncbi:hypothetical protein [Acidimangrovimonas pyrenivorans]|uniref:Uncharacterized protein n=1 Tax=Acidimangrovimonas pyrenivorans TaxID=2030798 RepID=A0ABV7AHM7_9RHOB
MEFAAFLNHLRTEYVIQFEGTYEQQKTQYEELHPEIAFEVSGTAFKHLYVVDFLAKRAGKTGAIDVVPNEKAYAGGVSFSYAGMSVGFGRVSWDAMAFDLKPVPAQVDGFETWFDKWMDLDGQGYVEGTHYSEIIHSATLTKGHVEVDFGTAPIGALTSLLRLFSEDGVREVEVSTSRTQSVPGSVIRRDGL